MVSYSITPFHWASKLPRKSMLPFNTAHFSYSILIQSLLAFGIETSIVCFLLQESSSPTHIPPHVHHLPLYSYFQVLASSHKYYFEHLPHLTLGMSSQIGYFCSPSVLPQGLAQKLLCDHLDIKHQQSGSTLIHKEPISFCRDLICLPVSKKSKPFLPTLFTHSSIQNHTFCLHSWPRA